MIDEDEERLLNENQTEWLIGWKRTKIDNLIKEGKLKPIMEGGRRKFSYKEVRRYIEHLKMERDRELKNVSIRHLNFELNKRS